MSITQANKYFIIVSNKIIPLNFWEVRASDQTLFILLGNLDFLLKMLITLKTGINGHSIWNIRDSSILYWDTSILHLDTSILHLDTSILHCDTTIFQRHTLIPTSQKYFDLCDHPSLPATMWKSF